MNVSGNMVGVNYRQARLVKGNVSIETTSQSRAYPMVIKIEKAGICRADVKEVQGTRAIEEDRGAVFGHEFTGKIVHSLVAGLAPGEVVTFNPNVTRDRTTGFAEYVFIGGEDDQIKEAVMPLPKDLLDQDWLPEPFACVVHSMGKFMQHSQLTDLKGMKVGILGAGTSGLEFGFLTTFLGADVTLFNRGRGRIDFTRNMGYFGYHNIQGLDGYRQFSDMFDAVIVSPTIVNNEILGKAAELVKSKGFLHLYGGTVKGTSAFDGSVDIDKIRRQESNVKCSSEGKSFNVCGAHGCTYQDFQQTFQYYGQNRTAFPLDRLISTRIAFTDLPKIVMDMADGTADFPGRVLVEFNG